MVLGALLLGMDGFEYPLAAGDSIVIPSNISHNAIALDKSVALDIFAPRREDYL
jgi:quercetin dioxygenase-like cupin family protein